MKLSKIQWTEATMNFWIGCSKVSEGCKFCYMFRILENGKYSITRPCKVCRTNDAKFYEALYEKRNLRIFTCSMSDFFIEDADEWRDDAWKVIRDTPQHTWMILTKRPERIKECLPADWGEGYPNVWLGVSIEMQKYMSRAVILADIPAKVRFISAEPLLEPVDFLEKIDGKRVIDDFQWIIYGGESGFDFGKYRYRPLQIEWIEKSIEDLKEHAPHLALFVKQLGTYQSHQLKLKDNHGGNWDEWPQNLNHLKIRDYPESVLQEN